jgi:hydrophobe/amphiphile efflux-3 (HAE3) family protein
MSNSDESRLDRWLSRADTWIVDRPKAVILVFLILTAGFAVGTTNISTESGTSQFIDGVPAQEAFENVNDEFLTQSFEEGSGSTQLIQRETNVLSKPAMLRMLTYLEQVEEREGLRVDSMTSPAAIVAQTIDPTATTIEEQQRVIESATPTQIDAAVAEAAGSPGFTATLSNDFNPKAASASASISSVQHNLPGGTSDSAGSSGTSPLTPIQTEMAHIAESTHGITVFGSGIISAEFGNVIGDSLAIVVPAAAVLILLFLVVAYRDPIDLVLGLVSLVMAIIWTFGFMGLAGIPFGQMTISVPVILLAVGIDFGIHAINRYREERVTGKGITESMRPTTDQLLVAFSIVTGTTVVGFGANLISDLGPIRNFGLVAAIGIIFTFLIFGVFLPAMKVYLDTLRVRVSFPDFGSSPLGDEGSIVSRALTVGNTIAKRAPKTFLVFTLVVSVAAAGYGAGVDTSFSDEDFLPPEELPQYVTELPEPFAPGTYTATGTINYLEDNFQSSDSDQTTIYVSGDMRKDTSLEQMHRAMQNPPGTFVVQDRKAKTQSIVTVIQQRASQDPEFARLVSRNDRNDNGIPDDNLEQIYDALFESPAHGQATSYLTEDYRSARIVASTDSDATQTEVTADSREVADRFRLKATATGQIIVFEAITTIIFNSAFQSLLISLALTALFLVMIYWVLEREPGLGIVNLVPIIVSIALLAATMRYFGIPFNALTATIFSIAIGLGVDYSAHLVHRFAEEYDETNDLFESLDSTVRGTGGALAGSMLTTTCGTGVLALAITPVLGQFGLVIALAVFYSFIASVLVFPSTAVVWEQITKEETPTL